MKRRAFAATALLAAGCSPEPTTPTTKPAVVVTEPASCAGKGGCITTIAGIPGEASRGADGTLGWKSALYWPQDSTVGPDGKLYYIDWNNHRVRSWDPKTLLTTTVAGAVKLGDVGTGEPALDAALNHPTGLTFDSQGRLVIAAWHNSKIKRVDLATGVLSDVCGTGARAFGGDGGPAAKAKLDLPSSIEFDSHGNAFISDQANERIRKIDTSDVITTYAGGVWATDDLTKTGKPVVNADGNYVSCASPTSPVVATKASCTWDPDQDDKCKKDATGAPVPFTLPSADLCGGLAGDGGPASKARLESSKGQNGFPAGRLVIGKDDVMYIADTGNHRIRKIDPVTGTIDTIAGSSMTPAEGGYSGDGGDAKLAKLNNPTDVALLADGALLVADKDNDCIRIIKDGKIDTFAGQCGKHGFSGDGGEARKALMFHPYGLSVGPDGTVYVADTYNHVMRMITK
jgi:sugar lactone lactonase YvrE